MIETKQLTTRRWTLEKVLDPDFKIDVHKVITRTKRMVAFDKGLRISEVRILHHLENDLNYTVAEKQDLKGPIERGFFSDVEAKTAIKVLAKVTTVKDLAETIYYKFIPESRKK